MREQGIRAAVVRTTLPIALALSVHGALACGIRDGSAVEELSYTFGSAEDAGRAVLEAVAQRDVQTLRLMPLTEHEFRTVVWPELPASRADVSLPFAYAWGTLAQNSAGSLAQILDRYGGQQYELTSVRVSGDVTAHPSFTVHRKVELAVRNAQGEPGRLRLFGSLLERQGQWKIFSYVVD